MGNLYIGSNGTRSVVEINDATGAVEKTISLPVGSGVSDLAYNPKTLQVIVAYPDHFQAIDQFGNLVGTFGSAGNALIGPGHFDNLSGVGVDPNGCVLAADGPLNVVDRWCPCTPPLPVENRGSSFLSLLERGQETPTPTPKATLTPEPTSTITPTPTPNAPSLAVAAPNISRGGEPIVFLVNLEKSENLDLKLFSLSGEKIFEQTLQGNAGVNMMNWGLNNQSGSLVASGLYIYLLEANDGTSVRTQSGKVVVIH